jgi:hypothetical protein
MMTPNAKKTNRRTRHYFFLNPYENEAFTRCPTCGEKTKVRKYPLVIHIEPHQILCLNKSCKYCEACDLIIGKQSPIEYFISSCCEKIDPSMIGNKYLVFGTLNKADWKQYSQKTSYPQETLDKVYVFKDVLKFEVVGGGWYKDDETKK